MKVVALASVLPLVFGQDTGYELLWESALDQFENKCIKTKYAMPAWAQGDFVIPSLGQFELNDRKFVGQLDGFGKMQKFEMKADEVCATYRIMGTGFYNESIQEKTIAKGLLFFETDPPRKCPVYDPICNLQGKNDNTFVNTFKVGGKLLSITDSPVMLELDPDNMEVLGPHKFNDDMGGGVAYSASAHGLPHPTTGEWIDFVSDGQVMKPGATIKLFSLGADDPSKRKPIGDGVKMDTSPYMHSFGLTAKHVVFPRQPVEFDVKQTALGPMHTAFKEIPLTHPGEDNGFVVVPMDGSTPTIHALPIDQKLYFTHTVNCYENESGIVIDLCTLPANPFAGNLTVKNGQNKAWRDELPQNFVKRFLLPFDNATNVTTELISDAASATDFTSINYNYRGVKHCYYYGVQWFTDGKAYGSMAIAKYDMCNGGKKKQFYRPNWFPSEATFIASEEKQAAEDDGLLVLTSLNGETGETFLITLDAKTMEPVSEVGPFPRIAFTTHGEFYQQKSRDTSSTQIII